MSGLPLLSLVTFVPLLGALAILIFSNPVAARWIALGTTIVTFIISLMVWAAFDTRNPGFQLVEKANWLGGGISYHMGVDGISMLFVVLTAGLMPFCIAASWESIQTRVAEYMIAFLVLETMMIGVFCALDLVLFYVLFGLLIVSQRVGAAALVFWQLACAVVLVFNLLPQNYLLPATTFLGYYNFGFIFGIAIAMLREHIDFWLRRRYLYLLGGAGTVGLLTCFVGEWRWGGAFLPSPATSTLIYFVLFTLVI